MDCDTGRRFVAHLGLRIAAAAEQSTEKPPATDGTGLAALAVFNAPRLPPISIQHYAIRLFDHLRCSAECFALALVYLDRALAAGPDLLRAQNAHRLLLTGVVVATKFHDDTIYTNAHYARAGGLAVAEMNRLEATLLHLIGWRLRVTTDIFHQYCTAVIRGDPPQMPSVIVERPAEVHESSDQTLPSERGVVSKESGPAKSTPRQSTQKTSATSRSWPKQSPPRRSPPARGKLAKASPGGSARNVRSAGKRVGLWGSQKRGVAMVRLCRAASQCLRRAVLPRGSSPASIEATALQLPMPVTA